MLRPPDMRPHSSRYARAPLPAFRFGRLISGPRWPAQLPSLDRLAAVPALSQRCVEAASEDVVLYFESSSERRAVCATQAGGPVHWSVDPFAWIRGVLEERYVSAWRRPLTSRLPWINYSRFPNALKGAMRRLEGSQTAEASNQIPFPAPPFDGFADRLRELCFALAFGSAPRAEGLWPSGRRAAVTVAHDVDTPWVLDARRSGMLREILDAEGSLGFRGAWYLTASTYQASRHASGVERIRAAGHEIGAHGWNHDSKLNYLSAARQEARVRKILERLGDLGVTGIRTPWYCRSAQLYSVLSRHFTYSSSVPNASAFYSSGSNSGCCTIYPYEPVEGLVELPMTLPPDTLLPREGGDALLRSLADEIVERAGVVVISLHLQPHQSANEEGLRRHFSFLGELAERHGERLWHASPSEVVRWYTAKIRGDGD